MLMRLTFAAILLCFLNACDVDQTEEGESPEVEAESELPAYDVDAAEDSFPDDTPTVEIPEDTVPST